MPGAIRPSWVDKATFLRMPFNFCDRWCERCDFSQICRVFQREQKTREKLVRKGKNPNSWEGVFETIKESLKEARQILKKQAGGLGIDLTKIKTSKEEDLPDPNQFFLYRLVNKFAWGLDKLVADLGIIPSEADENLISENVETISYYRHFLPAKTYRAIISKIEEENSKEEEIWPDSKVSAFLAINAFLEISEALVNLAWHNPLRVLQKRLIWLSNIALELVEIFKEDFEVQLD